MPGGVGWLVINAIMINIPSLMDPRGSIKYTAVPKINMVHLKLAIWNRTFSLENPSVSDSIFHFWESSNMVGLGKYYGFTRTSKLEIFTTTIPPCWWNVCALSNPRRNQCTNFWKLSMEWAFLDGSRLKASNLLELSWTVLKLHLSAIWLRYSKMLTASNNLFSHRSSLLNSEWWVSRIQPRYDTCLF